MEKALERKFTTVLQLFVHYSGVIAGVKLLRYVKESAVHENKMLEFLKTYPWYNVQPIPQDIPY